MYGNLETDAEKRSIIRPQHILFDLDGTLIDSREGITKSVAYALSHFGIHVEDRSQLYAFIGPPLSDSFSIFYHFNEDQTRLAVQKYRERYAVKGVKENKLYKGIETLLQTLKSNGYQLYLATSKPENFAKEIIDYFSLTSYFTFIGGSRLDNTFHDKVDVINYVLQTNHISRENAIMIGDRKYDIEGADLAGIASIGVLYGFGNKQELQDCHCKTILHTVDDIRQYFCGK
ncbi:MAG: HAD hydrolase-like protein [Bacteroidales bacterium]|nr:HAD hydrolase-like protein [Bacteroidales bacterium]